MISLQQNECVANMGKWVETKWVWDFQGRRNRFMSEEMLIQSLENIFAPINVSQVVSHEDVNGGGMGNVL